MSRTRHVTALALGAVLALPAAPAAAQTPIFTDDAEGAIESKWVVGPAPDDVEPWQKSDSSTTKYRGNQFHGGAASYWTGVQPQNWPPVPTTAGPGTVIEGESLLTLKEPIVIPADGQTTLKYWSLFQNEGDDNGISQIAVFGADGKLGPWKTLKSEAATATGAGDNDPRACDPTRPDHTNSVPFSEIVAPLGAYAGFKAVIRFNLKYGAENRPVSHPCGWYVDDISILSTGTPGKLAGAAEPAPGGAAGGAAAAPPAKPTVKLSSLKRAGRRATLTLKVTGANVQGVRATLLKGKRKLGTAKAASLATGTRRITFKLKRKLARGAYTVKLTGKDASGGKVSATRKLKAR